MHPEAATQPRIDVQQKEQFMRLTNFLGTQGRGVVVAILMGLLAACGSGSGGADGTVGGTTTPTFTAGPASVEVLEGDTATFTVAANGTNPIEYQWKKNGADIAAGTGTSYTTPATDIADDGAQFTVSASNVAGSVSSGPATLTVRPRPPSIVTQPADLSVAAGQSAQFDVVAIGTRPLAYQWSRAGTPIAGATSATYGLAGTTVADDGATFSVAVSNAAGSATSSVATLRVTAAPVPPTITAHPQPQSVTVGQAATFAVTAAGTAPLTYQWQRDGVDIAGATAASWTTAPAALADSGAAFRVRVDNATGLVVTSSPATLTVRVDGPTITAQPASTAVLVGRAATFNVAATGTAPVTFQWRRNGADLRGETSTSFTVPATLFADHGAVFTVRVTDAKGAVLSNEAVLSINPVEVASVVPASDGAVSRNVDGSVWLIGAYPGNASGSIVSTPLLLRDASNVVITGYTQISGGETHVLARKANGTVEAFGSNLYGQVGIGVPPSIVSYMPPRLVVKADGTLLTGVDSVEAGDSTSYARMSDGTLLAWGFSSSLGIGTLTAGSTLAPTPVIDASGNAITNVSKVVTSSDADHAMALKADGSLWIWGRPECLASPSLNCLPGDGSVTQSAHAVVVRRADGAGVTNPRSFSPGNDHTVVAQSDGTVLAWGYNTSGQLGDGTNTSRGTAVQMRTLSGAVFDNVVAVGAGRGYTVLLRADGSVWSTGENGNGELGDGTSVDRLAPVPVIDTSNAPLANVVSISVGRGRTIAKKSDGSFWGWGYNYGCAIAPCDSTGSTVLTKATRITGFTP
jgi:alpha-tubulin suppressor-like RCC1 family protein